MACPCAIACEINWSNTAGEDVGAESVDDRVPHPPKKRALTVDTGKPPCKVHEF